MLCKCANQKPIFHLQQQDKMKKITNSVCYFRVSPWSMQNWDASQSMFYFEFPPLKIGWRGEGYCLLFPNQTGGQGSALPRSASQCVVVLQWIIKPFERSVSSLHTDMHVRYTDSTLNQTLFLSHILTIKNKQFIFSHFSHSFFSLLPSPFA